VVLDNLFLNANALSFKCACLPKPSTSPQF
jgi:hypothetical protein